MENRPKIARKSVADLIFDRNRLPNRSGERFGLDFPILEVLLAALGGLDAPRGAPLGDLGRPRGRLWGALGCPGGPWGVSGDAPGTLLGGLWAPGVDLGGF